MEPTSPAWPNFWPRRLPFAARRFHIGRRGAAAHHRRFLRDRTPAAAIIMNEAQNDPAGPQKLPPALMGAPTSKRSGQRHPIGHEMTASPWTPSFPGFFGLELFN